jgi:hypothetical protein
MLRAYGTRRVHRLLLSIGKAVRNKRVLDDELIDGYISANASDPHRRAKTARFLAGQLDPANSRCTMDVVDHAAKARRAGADRNIWAHGSSTRRSAGGLRCSSARAIVTASAVRLGRDRSR